MVLISTHSGLRGPANELTHDVLEQTIADFTAVLSTPSIAVARDDRATSEGLAGEVIDLARGRGVDVVDMGVAATPAARIAARNRALGGLVVVTGSHLEQDHNGLKLAAGRDMRPVPPPAPPGPSRTPAAPSRPSPSRPSPSRPSPSRPSARGGLLRDTAAAEEHVAAICAAVGEDAIRSSGLSLAFTGGAGESAALLVARLGAGDAPDVELRLDADGDRVELVDERGTALDAELTLALAIVARDAQRIVKGADTSRAIEALAAQRGASVHVVPPGELYLFDAVRDRRADLAGEGNGGVIVPAVGPGRDGLAAGAAVVSLVARSGSPLSELAAEIPVLGRVRSTVPCDEPADAVEALNRLAVVVGVPGDDRLRGVEIEEGEAWGLVRLSATEPHIRITAEAPTQDGANELHARLEAALLGAL